MSDYEERVAVIILTVNQKQDTLRCLSSLSAIKDQSVHILVWDNNSSDGTVEAVHEAYPEVLIHKNSTNLGVASGRNEAAWLAIRTFNPSHLLFLDNDMLVEPNFVGALLEPFRKVANLGQTQAKLRLMNQPDRLNDGGGLKIDFLRGKTGHVGFFELDNGQFDQCRDCVACGGAMMVRTDLFVRFGGFDKIFDPYGPEDLDFSLRLKKAGYRALFVPEAVAYHTITHTFGKEYDASYARHKARHWFIVMRRHAPFWKLFVFLVCTGPWLVIKIGLRETNKGNHRAIRGLLRGVFDIGRSEIYRYSQLLSQKEKIK